MRHRVHGVQPLCQRCCCQAGGGRPAGWEWPLSPAPAHHSTKIIIKRQWKNPNAAEWHCLAIWRAVLPTCATAAGTYPTGSSKSATGKRVRGGPGPTPITLKHQLKRGSGRSRPGDLIERLVVGCCRQTQDFGWHSRFGALHHPRTANPPGQSLCSGPIEAKPHYS